MDGDRPRRVLTELRAFLAAEPAPPEDPRQRVVELFHRVAGSVPAYRAFLQDHGVDPGEIRTFADFERLPLLTKENYHRRYPRARLEASGGLRLETARAVAQTGVDFVAVGALTHSSPALDLGLDIPVR